MNKKLLELDHSVWRPISEKPMDKVIWLTDENYCCKGFFCSIRCKFIYDMSIHDPLFNPLENKFTPTYWKEL